MAAIVYDIIINTGDESLGFKGFIKYRKISNKDRTMTYLKSKYPNWKFATVYNKATREKIEVLKP